MSDTGDAYYMQGYGSYSAAKSVAKSLATMLIFNVGAIEHTASVLEPDTVLTLPPLGQFPASAIARGYYALPKNCSHYVVYKAFKPRTEKITALLS